MFCRCGWKSWLGTGLWCLAVLALVLAWVAVFKRDLVFGLEPLAWYWNALVVGVLALPLKDNCASGSCSTE
ncbi:MAG: hypothetical protein AAB674_00285 [Patescibacteria group bacterium]